MSRSVRRHRQPESDTADLVAAVELVIAALDGRPTVPLLDVERLGSLIGGFMYLTAQLGERLVGADQPAAFRALLTDIQARERLASLFGERS